MKVAMIEPGQDAYHVYSEMGVWPLLGPVLLGTILKNEGFDVTVIDENLSGKISKKELSEFDAIGISILTTTSPRGYDIAQTFKEINPKGYVVFGGIHATFLPNETLRFGDCVLVGGGEKKVVEIFKKKKKGIVYGERVNLDENPVPDFSLMKDHKKLKVIPIQTSRGCPWNCEYCSVTKMDGRVYRFRDTDLVIDELKSWRKGFLFFYDDNFLVHKKRTKELLRKMIKENFGVKFIIQATSKDIAEDEELVMLLAKAGCRFICIGFESESQAVLDSLGKKIGAKYNDACIKNAHKYGIKIHGMYMDKGTGNKPHPKIDTLQLSIETPIPGSDLFERVKQNQEFLEHIDPTDEKNPLAWRNWKYFDGMHVVNWHAGVSPRDVGVGALKRYIKFYSLPRIFEKVLYGNLDVAYVRYRAWKTVRRWIKQNREFMAHLPQTPR